MIDHEERPRGNAQGDTEVFAMARLARAEVFSPTTFTLSSVRGPTSWPREGCLRDAKLNFQASVLSKAFQTGTGSNGLVPTP